MYRKEIKERRERSRRNEECMQGTGKEKGAAANGVGPANESIQSTSPWAAQRGSYSLVTRFDHP